MGRASATAYRLPPITEIRTNTQRPPDAAAASATVPPPPPAPGASPETLLLRTPSADPLFTPFSSLAPVQPTSGSSPVEKKRTASEADVTEPAEKKRQATTAPGPAPPPLFILQRQPPPPPLPMPLQQHPPPPEQQQQQSLPTAPPPERPQQQQQPLATASTQQHPPPVVTLQQRINPRMIQADGSLLLWIQFRRDGELARALLGIQRGGGERTIHARITYSDPFGLYDMAARVIFDGEFHYAADEKWAIVLRKDEVRIAYGDPVLSGCVQFRLMSIAKPRLNGWETMVPRFYFDYVMNKSG